MSETVTVPVPPGGVKVTVRWFLSRDEFLRLCDEHAVPASARKLFPTTDWARAFVSADVEIDGQQVILFGGEYGRRSAEVSVHPVAA